MAATAPPVSVDALVGDLLARPSRPRRRRCLGEQLPALQPDQVDLLAEALKEAVVRSLWSDLQAAEAAAWLIHDLARLTGRDLLMALALRMRAQALMLGFGEYQRALRLYRRALAIHRRHNDELGQAMIYLTSVWAMANIGQHAQALAAGEWAAQVLQARGEWRAYATLQGNLAAIHNRSYDYQRALECTERARQGLVAMGEAGEPFMTNYEVNRVLALYHLGRYAEALQAGENALALAQAHDQKIVYARAQRNLAIVLFMMGQYNRALDMLRLARQAHEAAGQPHEAAQCELSATDFLLELNRLDDVLEKCRHVLPLFTGLGMRLEAAEAAHNQALAYQRLGRFDESIAALQTVRGLFAEEALDHWVAQTDTEIAQLYLRAGRPGEALPLALACAGVFAGLSMPYEQAQAELVAARAQLALGASADANGLVQQALQAGKQGNWPGLVFQANHLLARCAAAEGQAGQALEYYLQAIEALERLRGSVMLEFRSGFLEERETVYAEAVSLCLELGDAPRAFAFAERARSRALLELISGQEALRLYARQPEDIPLVEQIQQLAQERQTYVRRLDYLALDVAPRSDEEIFALQQRLLGLEKRLTELWHNLLVHNAAYAEEAPAWALPLDPAALPLEPGELLLSYFLTGQALVLFVVQPAAGDEPGRVQAITLPGKLSEVERLIQVLHLSLRSVPVALSARPGAAALESHTRVLLQRLYTLLLAPAEPLLRLAERLVIIPHGALHYLPFHALHDSQRYLVETHRVRILPAASFLHRPTAAIQSGVGQRSLLTDHNEGILSGVRQRSLLPHVVEGGRAPSAPASFDYAAKDAAPLRMPVDGGAKPLLARLRVRKHIGRRGKAFATRTSVRKRHPPARSYRTDALPLRNLPSAAILALGHSFQGRLPHTLDEARQVAALWGGKPILEEQATLERLRTGAPGCRLLHLACHGEFRADNPLFSGLALEDGWLTTFDIYNLPLNAALVTLSACQTGRTVAGGGGELFGLMRAFLSAGASALVLSLWPVADRAAAALMERFYRGLAAGEAKDTALRQAQLSLLNPGEEHNPYHHPYFWAPFFLVGDAGPL